MSEEEFLKRILIWIIWLFFNLLIALFVKLCWNLALVPLFPAIPTITYWKMVGLMFLTQTLLGQPAHLHKND